MFWAIDILILLLSINKKNTWDVIFFKYHIRKNHGNLWLQTRKTDWSYASFDFCGY